MSLFDKVRRWGSPRSPTADAEEKLRFLLQAAIEVVSAYGEFLERDSSVPTISIKRSEAELPFSKDVIKNGVAVPGIKGVRLGSKGSDSIDLLGMR